MELSETKRMAPFLIESHGQDGGVQESMAYISAEAAGQIFSYRTHVNILDIIKKAVILRQKLKEKTKNFYKSITNN